MDIKQFTDFAWYLSRALELVQTGRYAENGVSTAFWPVGYPAFLAAVLGVFGPHVRAGQFANLVLSLGCLILSYRWCIAYFKDARVACVAAWLFALYPNQMGYSMGLYSEPLFTLLLISALLLGTIVQQGVTRDVGLGVLFGLATLVKAQTLLLAFPLVLLLSLRCWTKPSLAPACKSAAIATLVMCMTIAPWTLRNHRVLGAAVPISTNGGMSLLAGNNPAMTLSLLVDYDDRDPLVESIRFSVADQVAADARAKRAAWGWISDNPVRFVALMPKKLFRFWIPDGESEWSFQAGFARYEEFRLWFRGVRVVNQAYYMLLLFACILAIRNTRRWGDPQGLAPLFILAYFTLISTVFSGQSRYHAPLMPIVVGFGAWSIVHWSRRRGHAHE
ncbi:MAG: glycosyltransferase family 39 protein [Rhodoferax sp.]|nr:glycosyltransferase family 39 protein [Rhodoferax sp.]